MTKTARSTMLVATLALTVSSCMIISSSNAFTAIPLTLAPHVHSKKIAPVRTTCPIRLAAANDNDNNAKKDNDDAARYKQKAEELRDQIRRMEETIGDRRTPSNNNDQYMPPSQSNDDNTDNNNDVMTLKNRKVLVVGANGRLGSMVCRYLLRNNPQTEVVAAVHYINEDSMTSRGWGRLSYEVGAEDGAGSIGAAWSAEDRVATFQYTDEMKDYNLRNLRLVDVELLDPVQCATITEDIDCVVWCATDFNGNKPRAVSSLNVAFLFRAVTDWDKGRVEIEGLKNILEGLRQNKQSKKWQERESFDAAMGMPPRTVGKDPIDVVLVSTSPKAFRDFETPFGTFNGLKREGETMVRKDFPSLKYTVLQMARYDDNFVEEGQDIQLDTVIPAPEEDEEGLEKKRINRRDAARAASEALTNSDIEGKTVKVWTQER